VVTHIILSLIFILALITGCSKPSSTTPPPVTAAKAVQVTVHGCRGCHPLSLDKSHDFSCAECHHGDLAARTKEAAHKGLFRQPAHPDTMRLTCGKCHEKIVKEAASTIHFTVAKEVNLVRQAFGAKETVPSLIAIPQEITPTTPLQLAEDLLRRRCLRCHLYSPGDNYPATRHGTGCSACHLPFANGHLASHEFLAKPTDRQCLSCHYGNRVGADYYGRFEHDVHSDFRTPFQTGSDEVAEPYGIGYHQLAPDIHQQAGMACIDCHGGRELMSGGATITCLTCHGSTLPQAAPVSLAETAGRRQLTLASTGKHLDVPVMKDPAHGRYGKKVACEVCHAQWSFADHGDHLLREDEPDFEPWQALTRQGSSEVERKLETALFQNGDSEATMTDGITGQTFPGIWLQAYELRRWEEINTCRDRQGVLQVCRPILDLHLSYTNSEGEVVFDGVVPVPGTATMLPYTPHTTGRAGAFYQQRLSGISPP
jgi:hypothetical protein